MGEYPYGFNPEKLIFSISKVKGIIIFKIKNCFIKNIENIQPFL